MRSRVFIVMYNFPPIGIGRGIAWNYFADEFSKAGYDVEVITTDPSKYDPYYNDDKNKDIRKTFKLTRIKDAGFYYSLYNKKIESNSNGVNSRVNIIKMVAIRSYKFLSRLLFYPDRMRFWSKKARKYLEKKSLTSKDIVISVGFPFSSHIEVSKLKKKTNCMVILDYGDPWSFNPSIDTEPSWRRKIDKVVESRILKSANLITVTTDNTKDQFIKRFGIRNIEVVRLGTDLSAYKKPMHNKNNNSNLTLVYTGTFYKEIRDPEMFFRSMVEIDKKINYGIDVVVAGRIDSFVHEMINRLGLNNLQNVRFDFLGNVGINRCIELQKSADMLLFFSNKNGIQVPGKIYEYLATDKPIICISYGESEAERILLNYNRAVIVSNDAGMPGTFLDLFTEFKKNGRIVELSSLCVYDYDWSNVSKKMLECLRSVEQK